MQALAIHMLIMADAAALEASVAEVEQAFASLARALSAHDGQGAIDAAAAGLQRALAVALDGITLAARSGPLPRGLRERLARVRAQVADQRVSLARANATIDMALGTLLPREAATYTDRGTAALPAQRGSARA